MITLTPRSNPIVDREQEVKEVASGAISRMIHTGIQLSNTNLGTDQVSIEGTLSSGYGIKVTLGETQNSMRSGDEVSLLEDNIEKNILSILDFGYTDAIQEAANIVQSRHPEDRL